jgi:hypothetical protein
MASTPASGSGAAVAWAAGWGLRIGLQPASQSRRLAPRTIHRTDGFGIGKVLNEQTDGSGIGKVLNEQTDGSGIGKVLNKKGAAWSEVLSIMLPK